LEEEEGNGLMQEEEDKEEDEVRKLEEEEEKLADWKTQLCINKQQNEQKQSRTQKIIHAEERHQYHQFPNWTPVVFQFFPLAFPQILRTALSWGRMWCSIPAPMPKRYISYITSSFTRCELEQNTRGGISGRSKEGIQKNTQYTNITESTTSTSRRKYGRW
jgi:hypothetical protein